MAGNATIMAAIRALLQATSLYSDAQVTLGDSRIMGAGGPCAIVYPGSFESWRAGDWSQVTYRWTDYVDVWRSFQGDDYTDIVADRQTVLDTINAHPTLGGTAGIADATARAAGAPRYMWPRNALPSSKPSHVGFRIEVQTIEERLYAGSGEFS